MGCASSIHISDRVVYHSGKESEDSHSPQQTNTTQHQGNPASGLLPLKPPNCKVREPAPALTHDKRGEFSNAIGLYTPLNPVGGHIQGKQLQRFLNRVFHSPC